MVLAPHPRMRRVRLVLPLTLAIAACAPAPAEEEPPVLARRAPLTVGGCTCPTSGSCSAVSYSDIPADNQYYVTTFGGGSDTQGMACGGTADGTWAYVADSARFGCGALLVISAGGKQCVAKVADCGPNRCVEDAASYSGCSSHFPIIDASPLITKYLLGLSGVGWSDKEIVTATLAPAGSSIGCPGVVPTPPPADTGPPPKQDAAPPRQDAAPPPPKQDAEASAKDAGVAAPDQGARLDAGLPPVGADAAVGASPGRGALTGGCELLGSQPAGGPAIVVLLTVLLALRRRYRAASDATTSKARERASSRISSHLRSQKRARTR